jgi:hypothetical protein
MRLPKNYIKKAANEGLRGGLWQMFLLKSTNEELGDLWKSSCLNY